MLFFVVSPPHDPLGTPFFRQVRPGLGTGFVGSQCTCFVVCLHVISVKEKQGSENSFSVIHIYHALSVLCWLGVSAEPQPPPNPCRISPESGAEILKIDISNLQIERVPDKGGRAIFRERGRREGKKEGKGR